MDVESIAKVAVIGAGTMGAGLAGEFARAGSEVWLVDVNRDVLEAGGKRVEAAQDVLVGAGRLTRGDADEALQRIRSTTDLEQACSGIDLLVEAISENLDLKRATFERIESVCPAHALFATNTSGLSITAIGGATRRPDRVAGMHFWNPPHIVPLVEVTRGAQTSDETAETLMDVCRKLGKRPILVQHDIPGFVGNRLQFAVVREALHLLADGVASAEDIDTAMTAGPGLRYGCIGPLRTADLGGLDIFLAISQYLFAELGAEREAPKALQDLVKAGKLGAKTGAGIYDYAEGDPSEFLARRDRVLLGFLDTIRREGGDGDE